MMSETLETIDLKGAESLSVGLVCPECGHALEIRMIPPWVTNLWAIIPHQVKHVWISQRNCSNRQCDFSEKVKITRDVTKQAPGGSP